MIIQTGMRTDIPAFYSEWFINRIKAGYVMVRNPYNPVAVTKYSLSPEVVDLIGFCTKNPEPMFKYMDYLKPYGQYWFVTITPYGKEIEPNVPDKNVVMDNFIILSNIVGVDSMGWRYDPIFITDKYSVEFHINEFERMAERLSGYTKTCVISFIDLYEKVKRNYPEINSVNSEERIKIGKKFVEIGNKYGITIKPCAEGDELSVYGADCSGCMTIKTFEEALHSHLNVPKKKTARKECACYLTNDIGTYNTCGHLCRYCYANYNEEIVRKNMKQHDVNSPFLIGHGKPEDIVHNAKQSKWLDEQMTLFDYE